MSPSDNTIKVRNPVTGEHDYEIAAQSANEIREIANRAKAAQKNWGILPAGERGRILGLFADAFERHANTIGDALSRDTGRRAFSHLEVIITVQILRTWEANCESVFADLKSEGASQQVPTVHFRHVFVPYPLVGVISPWNVPLLLALIDSIPALAAGSAVILKPSEVTPRFIEPVKAALGEVPELESLLNIVTGGPTTGAALIDSADAICFTGSVATGQKVAAHAASRFIPAFLELGGKDPAIVCNDASIELAVRCIIRSAIGMTGQTCQSLERIYVSEKIYDEFKTELLKQIDKLTLTCDEPESGDIGPLIFAKQVDTIQSQVDEAIERGAVVLRGGQARHEGGIWYPPTVLENVNHDMLIMREETFGPIIPLIKFTSEDEAIALANDTTFGLSGAVFSQDLKKAAAIGAQLEVGGVSINDASLTGVVNDVEKNSFKLSGLGGSRMGRAGLTRFLRKRALLTQTAEPVSVKLYSES